MTMKSNARLLLVLAAVGALVASPVMAEEPKDANSSGSVTIGAQGGSGIDTSAKLQEYETVHKGVFVPAASFSWQNGSNYFLNFKSSNLGLDDQFAAVSVGKKDGFRLNLSWDMNPNWLSNTARTPYTQSIVGDTAFYHVPDGMRLTLQNAYVPWNTITAKSPYGLPPSPCTASATVFCAPANPTQSGFFAVDQWVTNSPPVNLRYVRKTGTVGLTFPIGESLNVSLSYSREQRDGNKNTTFYGGPDYEVATPIAFRTHNMRAAVDFADGRWFGSAAVNASKFVNDVHYAEIDNPERLQLASPAGGPALYNDVTTFRLWLPPDNNAYSADLSGGVKLPRRHKIVATLSVGSMSMDTPLRDLSTNPKLATSATTPDPNFTVTPPYASVSAKYDTLMTSAKLTGDPVHGFGYSLTFRRYQLKDKTEEYQFLSTVRGDVGATQRVAGGTGESAPLVREHEGFDTQSLKGEVHVLPVKGLRLGVSYGQDKRNYDLREYTDVKDNVLVVSADYAHKWLSLHGAVTDLRREPGAANELPTWQGATQTDITKRHRKGYSGLATLTPSGSFAVTLSGMRQTNDFPESITGLLDQSFGQFGVDVTYARNEKFSVYAGYSYESYDTQMAAAYFPRVGSCATCGPVPPDYNPKADPNYWENATKDKVDTFRAGAKWTLKPEKIELNADLDYARPRNDSAYTFVPLGAGEANGVWPATPVLGFPTADVSVPTTFTGFPRVSKNFLIAKVRLSYAVDKRLTASVMWWKQKFDNVDWANSPASLMPYMGRVDPGANRWFLLGASVPSYDADIFRVALTYKF
jgi:hypothetical protein